MTNQPFQQRQQIPVRGLNTLTIFQMRTKIPAMNPELKGTPRQREILGTSLLVIGVVHERQLDGKHASVASQTLPTYSHASTPVLPHVASSDALFLPPSEPKTGRHLLPAHGISVPNVRRALLGTVCPTFMRRISLSSDLLAFGQQLGRKLTNLLGTQRASSAPLPRLRVLRVALVFHVSTLADMAKSASQARARPVACGGAPAT